MSRSSRGNEALNKFRVPRESEPPHVGCYVFVGRVGLRRFQTGTSVIRRVPLRSQIFHRIKSHLARVSERFQTSTLFDQARVSFRHFQVHHR